MIEATESLKPVSVCCGLGFLAVSVLGAGAATFGIVSAAGDGVASAVPARTFRRVLLSSNLAPPLAKTEPIDTSAN